MGIEGQISITINKLNMDLHIKIRSSRPVGISQIFKDKSPTEVLSAIPMIYSICGTAQGIASVNAFRSVLNIETTVAIKTAQQLLVDVETIREHYWRISLDWPCYLDEPQKPSPSPHASTWLRHAQTALFGDSSPFQLHSQVHPNPADLSELTIGIVKTLTDEIFGIDIDKWLEIENFSQLENWANTEKTTAAQMIKQHLSLIPTSIQINSLPKLDNAWLKQVLLSDNGESFAAQPQLEDRCLETTPLARQANHPLVSDLLKSHSAGLLSRLVARLVELATLSQQLSISIPQLSDIQLIKSDNSGVSQLEAARGRLIHCVALNNDVVSDYRIVAPTEWNFHPDGILKQLLYSITDNNEQTARLMINAVDPCVSYELEIYP